MARHEMRLHPRPFEKVILGEKTLELRLVDEKRGNILIGDEIEFVSRENGDHIRVAVTNLQTASSFGDILNQIDIARLAPVSSTHEDIIARMREYYSEEEEKKSGVVAIEFTKI